MSKYFNDITTSNGYMYVQNPRSMCKYTSSFWILMETLIVIIWQETNIFAKPITDGIIELKSQINNF